jgi:hypothetical protein
MMFFEGQKVLSEACASNSDLQGASLLPMPEQAAAAKGSNRRRSKK